MAGKKTISGVGCSHIFGCGDEVLIGVEINVETMFSGCM